jgi:hypothetical protein
MVRGQTTVIGSPFIAQRWIGRERIMDDHQGSIAPELS